MSLKIVRRTFTLGIRNPGARGRHFSHTAGLCRCNPAERVL